MASLHRRGETFWVKFRFAGKQVFRSIKTSNPKEASRLQGQIERTLHDLETGRLVLSEDADLWRFVLSDGKLSKRQTAPKKAATLGDLIDAYFASQIGQKELNTLETEQLHRRHFERVIGREKLVKGFTAADVQAYITTRSPDVKPQTVRKEVATLRMLLYRAERLVGEKPTDVRGRSEHWTSPKAPRSPGS